MNTITAPFFHRKFHPKRRAALLAGAGALLLSACSTPESVVRGPTLVAPLQPANYVEQVNNGAIFQASMSNGSLFSGERRPRNIGDTLKVDIVESLSASQKLATDTSRDNKLAVKGPGGSKAGGILGSLLNADATASGSDAYKGSGSTENTTSFNGQLAASVINVLPNGQLLVAGERSMAFNGGVQTLRFSGLVNPHDIGSGNVVKSADVVNARLEVLGRGDVSEASTRNWLQRLLTHSLTVW